MARLTSNAKKIDGEQTYLRNKKLNSLEKELADLGQKMTNTIHHESYWKLLEKFKSISDELHLYDRD